MLENLLGDYALVSDRIIGGMRYLRTRCVQIVLDHQPRRGRGAEAAHGSEQTYSAYEP